MTNERRQELIAEWQADLKEEAVRAERAARNEQLLGEIRDLLHDNDSRGETTLNAIRDLIIERNALRSDKQNLREIITRSRDAQQAADADQARLQKYSMSNFSLIADLVLMLDCPVSKIRTAIEDLVREKNELNETFGRSVKKVAALQKDLQEKIDALREAQEAVADYWEGCHLHAELCKALKATGVDVRNQPLLATAAIVAERFAKERPLLDALRAAINKAAPMGQPEAHYLTIATGLIEAIPCYRDRLAKADVRLREFEAKDARNTAEDPQPGDEVAGRLVTGRTPDRVFWKVLYSSRTYQCDIISWRKWVVVSPAPNDIAR